MKVRSITLGTGLDGGVGSALSSAGGWLSDLRQRFEQAGFEVQTTRVSLPPLGWLAGSLGSVSSLAREVEQAADEARIGYTALGPVRWSDGADPARRQAAQLAEALAATERVFGTLETADATGVRFEAARAAAGIVRALAEDTEAGFGNLRFAALARCPADIPFFPAAYHLRAEPSFGLALQAADLAVEVFGRAESLLQAEQELLRLVQETADQLEQVGLRAERELGVRYAGLDPTLAPFPDDDESIGAAIERLGVSAFGAAGTLAVAALVTRVLRAVRARRCGYSGLMLPVLEDSVLGRRAAEAQYSWAELLLYSAVCGTGLDTVPLPGDVSDDQLTAMIVDVSSLAVALDKPLTCRLFPVLGRSAGELATFDFPFFADAGVLEVRGAGSPGLIARGLAGERP